MFNPISIVSESFQILTNDHENVRIWNRLSGCICLLLLVSVSVLFSPSMSFELGLGSLVATFWERAAKLNAFGSPYVLFVP